jgi:PKD repeat protein
MLFASINRQTPLPIDILEPTEFQNLTAPVQITFGTESLRTILKKQSLYPRKFSWDFATDGKVDAERQEPEVTTVYRRKGSFLVTLRVSLTDGTTRTATRRVNIPTAVFGVQPMKPVRGEEVTFDVSDLIVNPKTLEKILWDFNGDDEVEEETLNPTVTYTFAEAGTYQAKVIIQDKSGLQETYVRPLAILAEREQPFSVSITFEGQTKGSAPLGLLLTADIAPEARASSVEWLFRKSNAQSGEEASGERVSHVFSSFGDYEILLTVTDALGRVSQDIQNVAVLEPLELRDLVLGGNPRPERNRVTGTAPLDVRLSAVTDTPFITFRFEQEEATRVFSTEGEYHALYEEPGTFPVLLIAKDAEDRTQKIAVEISVLPPKSRVAFTAIPATGIAPLTVRFDASESFVPEGRITGFSWTFSDGGRDEKPQLLGAQVTHRFEKEGTYTVTVRALTEEGQSYEARKTIVVRSPTLDACLFPSRTVGSIPMGVRFDASCSTGTITTYLWDFGDGATSEQSQPVQDHVYTSPGTYTVTLEVSDAQGNISQANVTISAR